MDEIADIKRRAGIEEARVVRSVPEKLERLNPMGDTEQYLQEVVDLQIEMRDMQKRLERLPFPPQMEQKNREYFEAMRVYLKNAAQHAAKALRGRGGQTFANHAPGYFDN